MYLKKLILKGFKSFPEKAELDFRSGVTGVVGPNGSGKSNVSDAIRWVIGEQNAKSLRGDKMADVIFAGTESRKPLSFAEVSIVMDNEDRRLNIDFNEVKVTRCVYRTGESEFKINDAKCNLKDIHKLFMDTGIGKEGYSIIGQGKIDAILSTGSNDRRLLFEEAAGIIGYKRSRTEAEKKLEETEENLIRINDSIASLEERLAPLERQAEKTKKFLILAAEQKKLRINIFVREYEASKEKTKSYDDNILAVASQLEDMTKHCEDMEEKAKGIKSEITKTELNLEEYRNRSSKCLEKKSDLENYIANLRREITLAERQIEDIKEHCERNKKRLSEMDEEIKQNSVRRMGLENRLSAEKEKLSDAAQELRLLREHSSSDSGGEEDYDEKIRSLTEEKGTINASLEKEKLLLAQAKERRSSLQNEVSACKVRLNESNVRIKAINVTLEKARAQYSKKKDSAEEASARIGVLKESTASLREEYDELNAEIKILDKNIARLKALSEAYEGYNKAVKLVLKNKDEIKGIVGAVAELFSVPREYETAVNTALGAAAQNIITEDETAAKSAMAFLKRSNGGRATFLPLTTIKARRNENPSILSEPGIIDTADNLISFDERYADIASNLLGRTIIADNIDNAASAAKKYKYIMRFVTLDGQVVNAGGSFTGGSVYKQEASIFSRERELKEAEEKKTSLSQDLSELSEKRSNADNELKEAEESSKKLLDGINELLLEINNNENKLASENENNERMRSRCKIAEENAENAKDSIIDSEDKIYDLEDDLKAADKQLQEIYEIRERSQNELREKRDAEIKFLETINSIRLSVNNIEAEINYTKEQDTRIENDKRRLNEEIEAYLISVSEKEESKKENSAKIEAQKSIETEIDKEYGEIVSSAGEQEKIKKELSENAEKINSDLLEITKDIGNLNARKATLEAQKLAVEEKTEKLKDEMWEEYGINYAMASEEEKLDSSLGELKDASAELKKKISSLGNVNPDAVSEFKEVKEEYTQKTAQREDILKAEEDIRKIIEQLSEEMEKQFKEQFAVINSNFKDMFAKMFNGGTASLKLEDEEDVLSSGIEIAAQPPGKALQRLSLLSGGERTLTALSLLFAILVMKPSPFCVLDETDAALDDENVNRYADFLQKFAKDEQFIVITHRQGTMQIADTLYGITQNDGVSSIYSLNLADAEFIDEAE